MSKRFAQTILIDVPQDQVWEALIDVGRWPEWTPTILKMEPLTSTPFGIGTRYRITQPVLQPAIYEVNLFAPCKGFTWQTRAPGMLLTAEHNLTREGSQTRLELVFIYTGLLGTPLGYLFSRLTTRYLRTEAEGLKRWCEAGKHL